MKKTVSALFILAAVSLFELNAQKFNPRVEVENTFEGKVVEATKKSLDMAVPDSLYDFRYNIDYSVFDNPYRGSYEFRPYKIEYRPEAAPVSGRRFFMNAGAGWSMHPEVDLVWSPRFKNSKFSMSVYDRLRGYWGYYGVPMYASASTTAITVYRLDYRTSTPMKNMGFFYDNKVGTDLRAELGKVVFKADAGYRIMTGDDYLTSHMFHMGEAELKLLPINPSKAGFFRGGRFYVNAGKDVLWSAMKIGNIHAHQLGFNDMGADLNLAVSFGPHAAVLFSPGIQTNVYTGVRDAAVTRAWATPQLAFYWNGGYAEIGTTVSYVKGSDRTEGSASTVFGYTHESIGKYFFPAVKIRQQIVPGLLFLYLKADGGDTLNNYADYYRVNPFFNPALYLNYMDASSERLNAQAGLQLSIAEKFQMDIHGGYAKRENYQCDAAQMLEAAESGDVYFSSYANYLDYNMIYADMRVLWQSRSLDIEAHGLYRSTNIFSEAMLSIEPAKWSADLKATYNWNRQAFVGVDAAFQSSRQGYFVTGAAFDQFDYMSIAGWVDLGFHASYNFNPKFGIWLKGGNLLGHNVYKYFLHPERGPWVTAGITLNL